MHTLKRTPLYDSYRDFGGKVVEYAGWEMPLQFEGIIQEHEAIRNSAGLFDVSHMGEIEVSGPEAEEFIQYLVTNDISRLEENQVLYALMCYEDGGVVDDLLIYKFSRDYFLLVVNASNLHKDFMWITEKSSGYKLEIINISDRTAEVAIQGPLAEEILQGFTETDLSEIKFFYSKKDVEIAGAKCLVSRTGYTGEDGFEIYASNEEIEGIWRKILSDKRVKPAGLGARDTLRFEANLPLYGNEISQEISPLEAGLGYFVKLDKEGFIGRDALLEYKKNGVKRRIVGFEMIDRGIPRHGYKVQVNGEEAGFVTTGYFSPSLKKNIGLALIDSEYSGINSEIEILIRNKTVKAIVIDKKFYKKNYKK